jgi:hypothetical protein
LRREHDDVDPSTTRINGKIQRIEQLKVYTKFVVRKRDLGAAAVRVRIHVRYYLSAKPRTEALSEILLSIKERHS